MTASLVLEVALRAVVLGLGALGEGGRGLGGTLGAGGFWGV